MRARGRVLVLAFLLILLSTAFPASTAVLYVYPDCDNQPNLACGLACTTDGCALIVYSDPTVNDSDYCYYVSGAGSSNCIGGKYHKCCM